MVYNFIDKKSTSFADKSAAGSGIEYNSIKNMSNEKLADELHKPIIRKLKRRKDHLLEIIFGVSILQTRN